MCVNENRCIYWMYITYRFA